jgi:hypothetical protein
MTQTSNMVDYRVATGNDETDILAVLEEVAPEIPLSVDARTGRDLSAGEAKKPPGTRLR